MSLYIALAGHDALLVDLRVRADDFDVDRLYACAFCYVAPSVARDLQGVDRVCDDRAAEAQVVFGEGVGDAVAFLNHGKAGVAQSLFDRVDAEVHCAGLAREFARNGRLAGSGQPAQDDEHGAGLRRCFGQDGSGGFDVGADVGFEFFEVVAKHVNEVGGLFVVGFFVGPGFARVQDFCVDAGD